MIGSHQPTQWRKGKRHCRRPGCKWSQTKPHTPRRPSNFADTVTFTQVMPPKDEK